MDTYQRVNRLPAKQNYEASKQLTDARFKRLVGVQRTTFEEMLAVLKTAYQLKHAKGGRKPKLSLEDLLMATLQYVREYRTYEQIAADFGIHESNLIRRSQWVEVTLVQSGVTISRTPLSSEDTVMIIDATEVKINRPKKELANNSGKKKFHAMKAQAIVTSQGRIVSLDIAVNYSHDMKLFKMSRRNIEQAGKILADSGYQGLMKIYPQVQTPRKSSKLKPLTAENKAYNHALSKERSKVENIFAKVKTFKIFSTTYRNHRKRFGLRMNLSAGIINHELGF
ncbi:IS5 family transposase [Streptococcus pneumoniae D39]|uniref:IS5 family transposase n=1 Tax=Streptococcus pneumoniae TaxID=1313 RepID=UPI001E38F436|nr:IS5 family transposase [Streptococcus pneumoniae]MCL9772301.1 IS5 family transposase [Streptococcus pneumoniae]MCL9811191.1 IS5 family transposase [Streptococcus pneumoniae D39]WDT32033.1 IS5 family transposase [Streptococcus pneumoniae D39]WDT33924.1 IS5 family transposase [Streptococcus pneumoniae D39]WDT35876.1 IS5 family transposase [Streptococcus pneumoniae D39]